MKTKKHQIEGTRIQRSLSLPGTSWRITASPHCRGALSQRSMSMASAVTTTPPPPYPPTMGQKRFKVYKPLTPSPCRSKRLRRYIILLIQATADFLPILHKTSCTYIIFEGDVEHTPIVISKQRNRARHPSIPSTAMNPSTLPSPCNITALPARPLPRALRGLTRSLPAFQGRAQLCVSRDPWSRASPTRNPSWLPGRTNKTKTKKVQSAG